MAEFLRKQKKEVVMSSCCAANAAMVRLFEHFLRLVVVKRATTTYLKLAALIGCYMFLGTKSAPISILKLRNKTG